MQLTMKDLAEIDKELTENEAEDGKVKRRRVKQEEFASNYETYRLYSFPVQKFEIRLWKIEWFSNKQNIN